MLGLFEFAGWVSYLFCLFWIGYSWWKHFTKKGGLTPAAANDQRQSASRDTMLIGATLVIGYFGSSLWPPFHYALYAAVIFWTARALKTEGPVWWRKYKEQAEHQRLQALADYERENTPAARAMRMLNHLETRDPYFLRSTAQGSARLGWIQHLHRRPENLFIDGPVAWEGFEAPEGLPYPWFGYPLGALVHNDKREDEDWQWVRYAGDGHRLIVGPPGSGKFHSGLAPLTMDRRNGSSSMIVFDPKDGEITRRTAGARSGVSFIAVIDPYKVTEFQSFRFNPLSLLRPEDEHLLQRVEDIREALLIPSKGNKDGDFWDTMARRMLDALILHVVTSPMETNRTLMRIAEIVDTFVPREVQIAMEMNGAGDGLVSRYAETMKALRSGKDNQRWNDICLTVQKSLFWLNTPQLRTSLAATDFDIIDLIYGRNFGGTLFIALPEKARSNAMAWLRVLYASLIDQLKEVAPDPTRHVHIILDEFPNLGRLDRVQTDLATTRGRYWHYHLAVQSLAQLRDLYGEGWEQILGQCAVEQVLGFGDNMTAEYYSRAAGKTTNVLYTESHSTTSGTSSGSSSGSGPSSYNSGSSTSSSTSYTEQHQQRDLLDPAELRGLAADRYLLFGSGKPPLLLYKPNVYNNDAERIDTQLDADTVYTLPALPQQITYMNL